MRTTRKNDRVPPRLVVVGSVGIDEIHTPSATRNGVLGGSATHACAAASFFAPTGMVGIVGTDFPSRYLARLRRLGVDLEGLRVAAGRTFRWGGEYEPMMDRRRTLYTELNVFAGFRPDLPEAFRAAPFLFLANISPDLQLHVLDQVRRPRFVAADTMDLWIRTARRDLLRVLRRIDLLMINESEALGLSGCAGLRSAAERLRRMGPPRVLVKRGGSGSWLFSPSGSTLIPAFPLEIVRDPTGAGDSFAGGFMGALAGPGRVTEPALRRAQVLGGILASFGVERFGLDSFTGLARERIDARLREFRRLCGRGT